MGMETLTLTDFLLARIAEDEAVARAASPGGWTYRGIDSISGSTLYDEMRSIASIDYDQDDYERSVGRNIYEPEADANGAHIARHDPARVLAECEAKRRIVEWHDCEPEHVWGCGACTHDRPCVLALLALPYADHPDYREEWRP